MLDQPIGLTSVPVAPGHDRQSISKRHAALRSRQTYAFAHAPSIRLLPLQGELRFETWPAGASAGGPETIDQHRMQRSGQERSAPDLLCDLGGSSRMISPDPLGKLYLANRIDRAPRTATTRRQSDGASIGCPILMCRLLASETLGMREIRVSLADLAPPALPLRPSMADRCVPAQDRSGSWDGTGLHCVPPGSIPQSFWRRTPQQRSLDG